MLRIPTFLRDAFERPSEKERRLLCAHRRDDGRTPPPGGTGPETPPTRENLIHMGDTGRDEDLPPDAEVRGAVERLEHGEEGAETDEGGAETTTARIETITAEDLEKRATTLKDRMGDIVRWLDDDELKKQLDLLVQKKPEYATLIAALRQNKEVYKELLQEIEPLLMETADLTDQPEDADVRFYAKTLATCLNKRWGDDATSHGGRFQRASDLLKLFEDIVNPEWEKLKELLPSLRGLGEEKEEDASVITMWTLWSMGLAAMKIWEGMEKARKEREERETTTFAYKFGKAIGMNRWNPEAFWVLQRDMYAAEEDIISKTAKQYKNVEFDQLIAFEGRNLKIHEPKYKNIAMLRAAAEQGFLYEIDDLGKKIYGTPLKDLVPPTWDDTYISAEFENLKSMQNQGKMKQEKEAEGEVNGYRQDGVALYEVEQAVKNKKYWKAVRIIKWITLSRVGTPNGGTTATVTLFQLLIRNPEFRRLIPPEIIKEIGVFGEAGIPEINIHAIKNKDQDIKKICEETDVSMSQQERARVMWDKFAALDITPKIMNYLRVTFTGPDGKPRVRAQDVYDPRDLTKLRERGVKEITDDMILAQAIGKVMEGHPVRTTDGQWIWIYDENNNLFVRYREAVRGSHGTLDVHKTFEHYDIGHFAHFNTGKMLDFGKIQSLFEYNRSSNTLTSNPSDVPRLTTYIASIAAHDIKCEDLVKTNGLPQTYLDEFRRSMRDTLEAGYAKIKAGGGTALMVRLIQDVNRTLRNEKLWSLKQDMPQWISDILLGATTP